MRTKGNITSWDDGKGYGFITPLDGGKRVFIHISAFGNRNRRPQQNEIVTYSLSKDEQGRPCAANATLAGDKLRKKTARKGNKGAIVFAIGFLVAIIASALTGHLSIVVPAGYLGLSLITFVIYAVDKSAAKRGEWRTGEGTLLLLGLAGGWPGGLIAQEMLRHKSKKTSFRAAFRVTVLINTAALAWLYTQDGQRLMRDLLG